MAPGIYAALEPRVKRFNDSNSVLIIGEHDVVVVDSQATLGRVRQLIAVLRELTDKPVRYVVNTHWHGDHTDGNLAWREAFRSRLAGDDAVAGRNFDAFLPALVERIYQEARGELE